MLNNFGEANRIHNGQEASSQSQPQLQPYQPHPSQPSPHVPGPLSHSTLPALSSRSFSTPSHLDEYFNCMFQPKMFSGQRNASSNFKRNPSSDYSFEKRSPYAVCYKSCCQPSPYSMNATATPSALQFPFSHPTQQNNPESIALQDHLMPSQSHQQSQQMDFHYLPSSANSIFNQRVSNPNSHETPSGIGSHYTTSNYLHPSFYNPRTPNFLPEYYERNPSKIQSPKSTVKQQTSVIKNSNDFPYASDTNQKSLPPANYIYNKRPENFLPSYLPPCSQPNFPPSTQYSSHRNPVDSPVPAPPYRNFNYSVPAATPVVEPKPQPEPPRKNSSKPPLDVRQFLETWDDDDDEPGVAVSESPTPAVSSLNKSSQLSANLDQRNSITDLNTSRSEYPVIAPDPENSVLFKILKPGGSVERGPNENSYAANLDHFPYNRVQLGIPSSPQPRINTSPAPCPPYPRTYDKTPQNYIPPIFQHDSMMYNANENHKKPDYCDGKVVSPAEKMCNIPRPLSSPSDLSQSRRVASSPKKTYLNLEHNVIKNNEMYLSNNQLKSTPRSRPSTPALDYDFRDPEQFIKPSIINKADYQRKDKSEESILKSAPKMDSKKGKNSKERNVSVVPPNNAVQRTSTVQRSDKILKSPNPVPYNEPMAQFHRNQIPYNKTTLMPYCMPPGNQLPNPNYDYPVMSAINNSHNYVKYDNRPNYAPEEPKYDNTCSVNINLNITSDKSPQVFLNSVSTPSPNHPPHSSPNDNSRLLSQSSSAKCTAESSDMHEDLHKKEKHKTIPHKFSENSAPSNSTIVHSHETSSTNFIPRSIPESIPEAFQIHSLISPHKSSNHAGFTPSARSYAIRDLSKMTENIPIHEGDSGQNWNKVPDLTSARSPYVSQFSRPPVVPAHCPAKSDVSENMANSSVLKPSPSQSCLFEPLNIENSNKRTNEPSTHFVSNIIPRESCSSDITEQADKSQVYVEVSAKPSANNSLTSEVFDTQYYKSCIYNSSSSKTNTNAASLEEKSDEIAQCAVSRPSLDINSNSIGMKHKITLNNDSSRIISQSVERLSTVGADCQEKTDKDNVEKISVLNENPSPAMCSSEKTVITSTLSASLDQTLQANPEKPLDASSNNIESMVVDEIFAVQESKNSPNSFPIGKDGGGSTEELFVDEETIDSIINERCDSFGAVEFPIDSSSQVKNQDGSDRISPLSLLQFPESERSAATHANSDASGAGGPSSDAKILETSRKAKVVSGMADLLNSDSDSSEREDEAVKIRRNKKRRSTSTDFSSFDLFNDSGTFFSHTRHKPGSLKNGDISDGTTVNDCYGLSGAVSESSRGADGPKSDELILSKSDNHTDFEMLVQNEMNKFNFESDILNNISSLDVEVEPPQFFSENSSTLEPKLVSQSRNDAGKFSRSKWEAGNKTCDANSDLNASVVSTPSRTRMDDASSDEVSKARESEGEEGSERNSSPLKKGNILSKSGKEEAPLKKKMKKKGKKGLDLKKRVATEDTTPTQNLAPVIDRPFFDETQPLRSNSTGEETSVGTSTSHGSRLSNMKQDICESTEKELSLEKPTIIKPFQAVIRSIDSLLESDSCELELSSAPCQTAVITSDCMKTGTSLELQSPPRAKSNEPSDFSIEPCSKDPRHSEAESFVHQTHSKKKKKKKKEKYEKQHLREQSSSPVICERIGSSDQSSRNISVESETVTDDEASNPTNSEKANLSDSKKTETPELNTSTLQSNQFVDSLSSNSSSDRTLIVSSADYTENQSSMSFSPNKNLVTENSNSQISNCSTATQVKKVEISVSPPSDEDSNNSLNSKIGHSSEDYLSGRELDSLKFPHLKLEERRPRNSVSQSSLTDSVIEPASYEICDSSPNLLESQETTSSKKCSQRFRNNLSESSTASSVISTYSLEKISSRVYGHKNSKRQASRYSSNDDDELICLSPSTPNNFELSQDEENHDEALASHDRLSGENDPFYYRKSTPRQILSPIKSKSDIETFSDAESLNDDRRTELIRFSSSLNPSPAPFYDQFSAGNNPSPAIGETVYGHAESPISFNQRDLRDSLSDENLDQEVEDCLKEVTSIRSKINNPPGNFSDLKPKGGLAPFVDDAEVIVLDGESILSNKVNGSNTEAFEDIVLIETSPENSPLQKSSQIKQNWPLSPEEIVCLDSPSIDNETLDNVPCQEHLVSQPPLIENFSPDSPHSCSSLHSDSFPLKESDVCSTTAPLIEQPPTTRSANSSESSATVNADVTSGAASSVETEESHVEVSSTQHFTNNNASIGKSLSHYSESETQEGVSAELLPVNNVLTDEVSTSPQHTENTSAHSRSLVPDCNFHHQGSSNDLDGDESNALASLEEVNSIDHPVTCCTSPERESYPKDSHAESSPINILSPVESLACRSVQSNELRLEKSFGEVSPLSCLSPLNEELLQKELNSESSPPVSPSSENICSARPPAPNNDSLQKESGSEINFSTWPSSRNEEPFSKESKSDRSPLAETLPQTYKAHLEESSDQLLLPDYNLKETPTHDLSPQLETDLTQESNTQALLEYIAPTRITGPPPSLQNDELLPKETNTESPCKDIVSGDFPTVLISPQNCVSSQQDSTMNDLSNIPTETDKSYLEGASAEMPPEETILSNTPLASHSPEVNPVTDPLSGNSMAVGKPPGQTSPIADSTDNIEMITSSELSSPQEKVTPEPISKKTRANDISQHHGMELRNVPSPSISTESLESPSSSSVNGPASGKTVSVLTVFEWCNAISNHRSRTSSSVFHASQKKKRKNFSSRSDESSSSESDSNATRKIKNTNDVAEAQAAENEKKGGTNIPTSTEAQTSELGSSKNEDSETHLETVKGVEKSPKITANSHTFNLNLNRDESNVSDSFAPYEEVSQTRISTGNTVVEKVNFVATPEQTEVSSHFQEISCPEEKASCKIINQTVLFQKVDGNHTASSDRSRHIEEKKTKEPVMTPEKIDGESSAKNCSLNSTSEAEKKFINENLRDPQRTDEHDGKDSLSTDALELDSSSQDPDNREEKLSENVRNSSMKNVKCSEKRNYHGERRESSKESSTEGSYRLQTNHDVKRQKSISKKEREETNKSRFHSIKEEASAKEKRSSRDSNRDTCKMKSSKEKSADTKSKSPPRSVDIPDKNKAKGGRRFDDSSRNKLRTETDNLSNKIDKRFTETKGLTENSSKLKFKERENNSEVSSKVKTESVDERNQRKYDDTEKSHHKKKYSDTPSRSNKDRKIESSSESKSQIFKDETKSLSSCKVGGTTKSKYEASHRSESHDSSKKSKRNYTDLSSSRSNTSKDVSNHSESKKKHKTEDRAETRKILSSNKQSDVISGRRKEKDDSTSGNIFKDNSEILDINFKCDTDDTSQKEDKVCGREENLASSKTNKSEAEKICSRNDASLKKAGIENEDKFTTRNVSISKSASHNQEKSSVISAKNNFSRPTVVDEKLSKLEVEHRGKLSKPITDLTAGREKPSNFGRTIEVSNKMKSYDREVSTSRVDSVPKVEVKHTESESRHKIEAYCPLRNWECPFVSKDNTEQMEVPAIIQAESWSHIETATIGLNSKYLERKPSDVIGDQDYDINKVASCSQTYIESEKIDKQLNRQSPLDRRLVNPSRNWTKSSTPLDSHQSQDSKISANYFGLTANHSENFPDIPSKLHKIELQEISSFADTAPKTSESDFVRTPRTPDSSFGRIPKTPESSYSGTSRSPERIFSDTPKTPEMNFDKAPTSPEISYRKIPKTPDINFEKAPKTPESLFERTGMLENSFERTSETPERSFIETPKTPESNLEDIIRSPEKNSSKICKPFGRSCDILSETQEYTFTKTPKTPDSSFGRAPKTPESSFGRAPKTPGSSFGRTSKTPERRFDKSMCATENNSCKILEIPTNSHVKTPERIFGRTIETSESNHLETPKTPEYCFDTSIEADGKMNESCRKLTESKTSEVYVTRTERQKGRQFEVKQEAEQNVIRNDKILENNDAAKKRKHKDEPKSGTNTAKSKHRSRKDSSSEETMKSYRDSKADRKKLKTKHHSTNYRKGRSPSPKSQSSCSKSKSRTADSEKKKETLAKLTKVNKDSPSQKNQHGASEEIPEAKNSESSKIKSSSSKTTDVDEPASFTPDFELDFDKHEINFDNFHILFDQTWEKFSKLKESSKKNKVSPKPDVIGEKNETETENPSQLQSANKGGSLAGKDHVSYKSRPNTDKGNIKFKINLPEKKQDDSAEEPPQQVKSTVSVKEANSEVDDNLKLLTNVFGTNKTKYKQSGAQYQNNRHDTPSKSLPKMSSLPLAGDHPIYYAENYKILDVSKIPLPPPEGTSVENAPLKNTCTDDPNVINIKLFAVVGNQHPERLENDFRVDCSNMPPEIVKSKRELVQPSLNSQEVLIPRQVSALNSVNSKYLGPVIPKSILPLSNDQLCPTSRIEHEQITSKSSCQVSKTRNKEALYSNLYNKIKHKRLQEKNRLNLEKELSTVGQDKASVPPLNLPQSERKISESSTVGLEEAPDLSEYNHQDNTESFILPGMIPLPAESKESRNYEDLEVQSSVAKRKNEDKLKENENRLLIVSAIESEPTIKETKRHLLQQDENESHDAPLQPMKERNEGTIDNALKASEDQKDLNDYDHSETVLPLLTLSASNQQNKSISKTFVHPQEELNSPSSPCFEISEVDSSKLISIQHPDASIRTSLTEHPHSLTDNIFDPSIEPLSKSEKICLREETSLDKECSIKKSSQPEFNKRKFLQCVEVSSKISLSSSRARAQKMSMKEQKKLSRKSLKRKLKKEKSRMTYHGSNDVSVLFETQSKKPKETSCQPSALSQNISSVLKSVKPVEAKPTSSSIEAVRFSSSVVEPYELEEGELEELEEERKSVFACPIVSSDSFEKILPSEVKTTSPEVEISEEVPSKPLNIDSENSLTSSGIFIASRSNSTDQNEGCETLDTVDKNSSEFSNEAPTCESSDDHFRETEPARRYKQKPSIVESEIPKDSQKIQGDISSEENRISAGNSESCLQKSKMMDEEVRALINSLVYLISGETQRLVQNGNLPSSKQVSHVDYGVEMSNIDDVNSGVLFSSMIECPSQSDQPLSDDNALESKNNCSVALKRHSLRINLELANDECGKSNETKIVTAAPIDSDISESSDLRTMEECEAITLKNQEETSFVSTDCNDSMPDDYRTDAFEHAKVQPELASEQEREEILPHNRYDNQPARNLSYDPFDSSRGESASQISPTDLVTQGITSLPSEICINETDSLVTNFSGSSKEIAWEKESDHDLIDSSSKLEQEKHLTETTAVEVELSASLNTESIQEKRSCEPYICNANLAETSTIISQENKESTQIFIDENSMDPNVETDEMNEKIPHSSKKPTNEKLAATNISPESSEINESYADHEIIVKNFSESKTDNFRTAECIEKPAAPSETCEGDFTEIKDQGSDKSIETSSVSLENCSHDNSLAEAKSPDAFETNQDTVSDAGICEEHSKKICCPEIDDKLMPEVEPTQKIELSQKLMLTSNDQCTELEEGMKALDLSQKMSPSNEENLYNSLSPEKSIDECESTIEAAGDTEKLSHIEENADEKQESSIVPGIETCLMTACSNVSENSCGEKDNFKYEMDNMPKTSEGLCNTPKGATIIGVNNGISNFDNNSRSPTSEYLPEEVRVRNSSKISDESLSEEGMIHEPLNLNVEMEVVIGSSGDETDKRETPESPIRKGEGLPMDSFYSSTEDPEAKHEISPHRRKRKRQLKNLDDSSRKKKKRIVSSKNIKRQEHSLNSDVYLLQNLKSEKICKTVNFEDVATKSSENADDGGRRFDDASESDIGNVTIIGARIETSERNTPTKMINANEEDEVFVNVEPINSAHLEENTSKTTAKINCEKSDNGASFLEPAEGETSINNDCRLSKKCKSVELSAHNVFSPEGGSNKSPRSMSYLRLKSSDSESSASPNYLKGFEHDSSNSFIKCFSFIKDNMAFITDPTACLTDSDIGSPSLAKEMEPDLNDGVCLPPAGSHMDENLTAALCDSQLSCPHECTINDAFSHVEKESLANPEIDLIGSEDNENMEPHYHDSKSESDLKVRLPWNRIFNLKKRKRKNVTSSKGIELGPAKIEIRLNSSENSGSWKVIQNSSVSVSSTGSNCSLGSPIGIKVNRLVLQRHPANDAESSRAADSEMPKTEDQPETIPKVIIKKNGTKCYKSYFKTHFITNKKQPVVRLLRERYIDEMALKLKEDMANSDRPSKSSEKQSPHRQVAFKKVGSNQGRGPKSRRLGSSRPSISPSIADINDPNKKATNIKSRKLPKLLREVQLDDPPEVDFSRPICLSTRRKSIDKKKVSKMSKTLSKAKIGLAPIIEESVMKPGIPDDNPENAVEKATDECSPTSMDGASGKEEVPKIGSVHQTNKRRKVEISMLSESLKKNAIETSSSAPTKPSESRSVGMQVMEDAVSSGPVKKKVRSISFDSENKGVYQSSRSNCQVCCAALQETDGNSNITYNQFHCTKCCLEFKSQGEEKLHNIAFHNSTSELQSCPLCRVSFMSKFSFKQHLKSRLHQLLESVQKETINTLYKHLTGDECRQLEHSATFENSGHEIHLTPLQVVLKSKAVSVNIDKHLRSS